VTLTEGLLETRNWNKRLQEQVEAYEAAILERKLMKKDLVRLAGYRVKKGDNYWKVAKRHQIDIDTIVGANPYLPDLFARLNQRILLLNKKGVLHRVERGETVASILDRYNKAMASPRGHLTRAQLEAFNDFRVWGDVREGDWLFVPNVVPQQLCEEMSDAYALTEIFVYPLAQWGKYSSFMGFRSHPIKGGRQFHNGVDIKVPSGSRVCSARSGRVVEAGWKGGYGNVVVIRHTVTNPRGRPETYETLYGHNREVLVKAGAQVKQGQIIAYSGSTGMSTGPHLHFTIWKNGKIIDPLKFLWR